LLQGVQWSVTFNGQTQSSTSNSITFSAPNGIYAFFITPPTGYTASSPQMSGMITVNGAGITNSITFAQGYTVTFTESSLPFETGWWVDLNGNNESQTSSVISFPEPNGVYTYSTGGSGYVASPSSGSITVNGASVSQAIAFTQASNGGAPTALSLSITSDPAINVGTVPFSVTFTAVVSGGTEPYSISWVITPSLNSLGTSYIGGSLCTYIFEYPSEYIVKATVTDAASRTASSQVTITAVGGNYLASFGLLSGWTQSGFLGLGQQTPFIQLEYSNQPNQGVLSIDSTSVSLGSNVYVNFAGPQFPSWLTSFLGISTPWYSIGISDQAGGPINTGQVVQLDMDTSAYVSATLPQGTPTSTTGPNSLLLYGLNFTASAITPLALAEDWVYILFALIHIPTSTVDTPTITLIVNAIRDYFAQYAAQTLVQLPFESTSEQSQFIQNSFGEMVTLIPSLVTSTSSAYLVSLADDLTQGYIAEAQLAYDALTLLGAIAFRAEVWDYYVFQQITPMLSVSVDPNAEVNAIISTTQGEAGYCDGTWGNTGNLTSVFYTGIMNNTYGFAVPVIDYNCSMNLTVTSPNGEIVPYSVAISFENETHMLSSTIQGSEQDSFPVTISGTNIAVSLSNEARALELTNIELSKTKNIVIRRVRYPPRALIEIQELNVSITVSNYGPLTETFNLTIYGQWEGWGTSSVLCAFTDVTLQPGSNTTLITCLEAGTYCCDLSAMVSFTQGGITLSSNTVAVSTVPAMQLALPRWCSLWIIE
jgi:hypothetical protein